MQINTAAFTGQCNRTLTAQESQVISSSYQYTPLLFESPLSDTNLAELIPQAGQCLLSSCRADTRCITTHYFQCALLLQNILHILLVLVQPTCFYIHVHVHYYAAPAGPLLVHYYMLLQVPKLHSNCYYVLLLITTSSCPPLPKSSGNDSSYKSISVGNYPVKYSHAR